MAPTSILGGPLGPTRAAIRSRLAALARAAVVLAALPCLLLAACTTVLDARAEAALRDALVRVVGPAESYDVEVQGASLDGSRFEHVRFVGRRIARANAPLLDRLELDLRGVVVDRAAKSLTAVASSRAELRVRGDDLAAYLRRSEWIADPLVRLEAPDRIVVTGSPRLAGVALGDSAEFAGRLSAAGAQLRLAVDRLRIGGASAPPLLRAVVERAINPLFDLAGSALPAQIDAVVVAGGAIRIDASGSRLPVVAP